MAENIDRERTEALAQDLVRTVFATPLETREDVFIVLDAIAWVAATVLAGTALRPGLRSDGAAMEFFSRALRDSLQKIRGMTK
jgi:hypothetical protein